MSSDEGSSNMNQDTVTKKDLEEGFAKIEERIAQTLLPQIIEQATAKLSESVEPKIDLALQADQKLQQSSQQLESRVVALEEKIDQASPPKLIELAETSFKTVLDADYHLDDKASRILSAMAFLTAAAAAIFAKAYSPSLGNDYERKIATALSPYVDQATLTAATGSVLQSLKPSTAYILGLDVSLLSFICYMFFILIGAAFYLAALGPSLNKPETWFTTGSSDIKSRLFYDFIGVLTADAWEKHWVGATPQERKLKPGQLQTKMENDFVFETRLLAEKARGKYLWMSIGSVCFRLAILFLIPLVASLFSSNLKIVRLVSIIGAALIIGVYVFAQITRPPRPQQVRDLHSWLVWLIAIEVLLLIP